MILNCWICCVWCDQRGGYMESYAIFLPYRAFLVTHTVRNLPPVGETWVWSLSQEDPLENGMALHSSILAWRTPWTEKPGGLQSMGSQRIRHDWANTFTLLQYQKKDYINKWKYILRSDVLLVVILLKDDFGNNVFISDLVRDYCLWLILKKL